MRDTPVTKKPNQRRRATLAIATLAGAILTAPSGAHANGAPYLQFDHDGQVSANLTVTSGAEVYALVQEREETVCWDLTRDGTVIAGSGPAAEIIENSWHEQSLDDIFGSVGYSRVNTSGTAIVYRVDVWLPVGGPSSCPEAKPTELYGSATLTIEAIGETMVLEGTPRLGSTVTVTAKVSDSLVGNDFDLWACPDQSIYPNDGAPEAENGDCVGPFIQARLGDSTSFLLGYDPVRDGEDNPEAEDFWSSVCDKYFIVHDYPGGGHSNWIGPVLCGGANNDDATSGAPGNAGDDTANVDKEAGAAELARTGPTEVMAVLGLGALLALLIGLALAVTRRRVLPPRG